MGISLGNDNMFLSRSYEVISIGTCTENPRVGSSILSLGTSNYKDINELNWCPFLFGVSHLLSGIIRVNAVN